MPSERAHAQNITKRTRHGEQVFLREVGRKAVDVDVGLGEEVSDQITGEAAGHTSDRHCGACRHDS